MIRAGERTFQRPTVQSYGDTAAIGCRRRRYARSLLRRPVLLEWDTAIQSVLRRPREVGVERMHRALDAAPGQAGHVELRGAVAEEEDVARGDVLELWVEIAKLDHVSLVAARVDAHRC